MPFPVKLFINDIGSHKNTLLDEQMNSCKLIIYATNGQGKSFVSKTFQQCVENDKLRIEPDKLLSFGKNEGSLIFNVNGSELAVNIKKSLPTLIQNNTNYMFHVFNSYYVDRNLRISNFRPDGRYIIGSQRIDLTEDKEKLNPDYALDYCNEG